ncbi:MAG: DUF6062 family protein [Chloroflexota bacterium]
MRLFSKPRPSSRHTAFFQVREALEREGCALCRLSLEVVARYLDGLAYENANDPVLRDRLRASRGFCPHHAWQIARLNSSALDVAIIYRDVLGEVARILDSSRAAPRRLLGDRARVWEIPRKLLPQRSCPACQVLATSEDRYLTTLLDHLPESDFVAVYRASEGLCQPHLDRARHHPALDESWAILQETALRSLHEVPGSDSKADLGRVRGLAERLIGARGGLTRWELLLIPTHPSGEATEEPTTEELIRALNEEGCPICRQVQEVSDGVLSHLGKGEGDQSLGLCNLHGWRLVTAQPEAALLAFQQMRHEAISHMETSSPPPHDEAKKPLLSLLGFGRNGHARAIQPPCERPCPVEVRSAHVEVGWAQALAHRAAGPEVQAAFHRASGLCLPHLVLALSCSSMEQGRLLAQMEAERVWDLAAELNEFVRKNDYRFRDEPWGREVTSPRRAVGLMVGAEGLRGVGGILGYPSKDWPPHALPCEPELGATGSGNKDDDS